ncbi:MAG: hypothetical protein EOP49_24260 [Sphingobacteriales bacterium]|nr:MAG: hypothetical protein EOP49_24260 [Sphingobacteriales bacterium]
MKKYKSYVRAVALSILAALLIDGMVNFDQYRQGWMAGLRKKQADTSEVTHSRVPEQIGKVTAIAFSFVFGRNF